MKGELGSRCFEACIYTEYTLFTPFSIPHLSFACASVLYVQQGSISPSLYPTKHTKSLYFIHIIILSIKVGNFSLSLLPLSLSLCLPLFNFSPVWLSLLGGAVNVLLCMCLCLKQWGGDWEKRAKGVHEERESNCRPSTNLCLTHGEKQWQEILFCSSSRVKW